MRPFSPYIAQHLADMLAMAPNRLAKRMKCSAQNADRVQKLIVLTLVKKYRWAQGVDATAIEQRSKSLAAKMARAHEGELAGVFHALMADSRQAGQPA